MNEIPCLKHIFRGHNEMNFSSCDQQKNGPTSKDIHVLCPEPVNILTRKANKFAVWIKDANQLTLK